jgi:ABC-type oligopeptide transport system substrate-binding subunit
MKLRRLSALLGVVGCVCLLAGSTARAAGEEIVVETFALTPSQPFAWIDPAVAYTVPGWQVGYVTGLRLLYYDEETGALGPDGATAMPTVSGDRKTYTFTIAAGHAFSDPGAEPVTAESFKRAIERATSPAMASTPGGAPARGFVSDIVGAQAFFTGSATEISGVDATANTLSIELVAPAENFPHRIAANFFGATPSTAPAAFSTAPLASAGPYYISSASASEVVLQRNPNYSGSRLQNLGTIRMAPHGSPLAEDYVDGPPTGYTPPPGATEVVELTTGIFMLSLNTSRAPFDDLDTRRAVAFAVDRTSISALLNWQPTDQFVSPRVPGFQDANVFPLASDTSTAEALLAGAPDPTPSVRLCHSATGRHAALAMAAEPQLEAVGFEVTRVAHPPAQYFTTVLQNPANCELATFGWIPDWLDPSAVLPALFHGDAAPVGTGYGFNASFFDDPAFNARFDAAASLTPETARFAEYADLDNDLAAAAPAVAIGYIRNTSVFSDRMGCLSFTNAVLGYAMNRLCIEVDETAAPGGTVSTGDEATPASPLQTSVTVPSGGEVTITQGQSSTAVPPGFALLEQQLDISAPTQTAADPLVFTFELDATLLAAAGLTIDEVAVYRNGSPIPDCTGAGATPDPCVASRTTQPDDDGEIVVRSSAASMWEFGERYDPADVVADLQELAAQNTPLGDKAGDALEKVQAAIAKLGQTPPDRQGALGELEGAVGDLEAAVNGGQLASEHGRALMVELAGAARLAALGARQEALDRGGNSGKIAEATLVLADGDAKWTSGQFKDAVAKYKDAVSKAEGA